MIRCAKDISPENALGVMRTFALALNLVNAAEVCHRLRGLRKKDLDDPESFSAGPLPAVEDSVCGTINAIMRENEKRGVPDGHIKEAIYDKLICQKVELVLTAHPTEVNRRTVLRKCKFQDLFFNFRPLPLLLLIHSIHTASLTLSLSRPQNFGNVGHPRQTGS